MLQLRFHFGERDRAGGRSLEAAVIDACARRGVEAAALLRGVEGFGAKHRLRTDRLLSLSEDAPLAAVAVGEEERIEGLAAEVEAMAGEGLIVLEKPGLTVWGPRRGPSSPHLGAVEAFKREGFDAAAVLLGVDGMLAGERRRARFLAHNRGVPAMTVAVGHSTVRNPPMRPVSHSATGGTPGVRVTLVTSEIARGASHPRYVEFIHELRRRGAAGAPALRGVWGFRGSEEPHGDRVLALRRDLPIIVEAIDTPERGEEWHALALSMADEDDVVDLQPVGYVKTLS
jgi:PII-like signaling protein